MMAKIASYHMNRLLDTAGVMWHEDGKNAIVFEDKNVLADAIEKMVDAAYQSGRTAQGTYASIIQAVDALVESKVETALDSALDYPRTD